MRVETTDVILGEYKRDEAPGVIVGEYKRGEAPLTKRISPFPFLMGLVSKVVIPVKTGIQIGTITHNSWIPAYAGMTKTLKNVTYDTRLIIIEGVQGDRFQII
jgi:hypothetical protein